MTLNGKNQKEADSTYAWNQRRGFSKAPFMGALFHQFFPNECPRCKRETQPQFILCGRCVIELMGVGPSLDRQEGPGRIDRLWHYGPYHSILGDLIRKLKYQSMLSLERVLAWCLVQVYQQLGTRGIFVVPVPPHPAAVRMRGFSHTFLLVKAAKRLGLPHMQILPLLRHRTVPYRPQASLKDLKERKTHVMSSFEAARGKSFPEHIVLFDDVYTSGATLEAAAVALQNHVQTIDAVVLACTAAHQQQ